MHTHTYIHVHTHTHTHIYIYTYRGTSANVSVFTWMCMCERVYVCIYVRTYATHVFLCMCMYLVSRSAMLDACMCEVEAQNNLHMASLESRAKVQTTNSELPTPNNPVAESTRQALKTQGKPSKACDRFEQTQSRAKLSAHQNSDGPNPTRKRQPRRMINSDITVLCMR